MGVLCDSITTNTTQLIHLITLGIAYAYYIMYVAHPCLALSILGWKLMKFIFSGIAQTKYALKLKLYIPSTLNIDLILWHTQLIVCAVKC